MSILSQVSQQRDSPALTGSSSMLGSRLHAGGVRWQLSGSVHGRKVSAVTRQRGGSSSKKGDGNHGKVAQRVLLKWLSYVQVDKTRKHSTAGDLRYKLVVQAFTIASHH